MLQLVKTALRLTVNAYDVELNLLISAALADLGIVGIAPDKIAENTADPLVKQAVITYCRMNFGSPEDYDRLRDSYNEQKAQLITATGYGLFWTEMVL